ncbi:MAG: ATP phosphoribosyltransferase [Salinisphaera sp.]|nr:ATP phosphoribosyltransferase [Salinisphaera sp.]MDN5937372.1 ATP phosphoribosyltransferase [Salinisphaera sp.]
MSQLEQGDQARLTLALSKGRILEQTLPLLDAAGIQPETDPLTSRKLVFATSDPGLRLLVIRAADVPTFVAYGAADLGVAGKDVLAEHGGRDLYEPLDLGIARCRLMVAGLPGALDARASAPLRVATKYVDTARAYFARAGRQVEIVKLYGSMELAPIVGLADVIVDLVDTGGTLRANGLQAFEEIAAISARLVVNKAAMKMKHGRIRSLLAALRRAATEGVGNAQTG